MSGSIGNPEPWREGTAPQPVSVPLTPPAPPVGLEQGRTMDTQQTRHWNAIERQGNDWEEGRRLFVGQTEADQGRSRRHIATCETPEQAQAVLAALAHARAEAKREAVAEIVKAVKEEQAKKVADGLYLAVINFGGAADFIAQRFGRTE